jgi:arylsulfatase A-like enzyme
MKRIHFYILFAIPVILLLGIKCADSYKKTSLKGKPNIILIMIDNVGYPEIGINGNELVKTPNLDHFASEGIRFSRFYSNPLCAPTRASLMTGRYYYRTGVIHTSRGGAKMHGSEVTIAELLKNIGYTTGMFGKWHLGDNYPMRPQDQGFNETLIHKSGRLGQVPDKPNTYINPKLWENGKYVQKHGYCTDIFFDAAIDFMQKHQNKPFFIYLPTNVAHATSEAGLEVPQKYSTPYLEMGHEKNIAAVCGMINNFDENFGRLTDKLSSLGLREKTLVIFLSDDGNVRINKVDYRGHGYATPYEGSIRVPCFVQWPGHLPGKIKVDHIANHIDILPTLLDATGTDAPDNLTIDGLSLLPLLKGKGKDWAERMIFLQCERGMTPHRYKNCAVISERFKLIGYPNTFEDRDLITSRHNPVLELYDISSDPGETTNLADRHPEILKNLRAAYDNWFDDVKSTRQFSPGLIHVGSDAENPVYLCRYQDATYIDKKPAGWPLFIERPGNYEVTVNRGESLEEGKLIIQFDSTYVVQALSQGENQAVVSFPEGRVNFNAWVKEGGKDYIPRPDEDKIGDVLIRRIHSIPR